MHAVTVTDRGGLKGLSPAEIERPERQAGEALMHVVAAGVNFLDIYMRRQAAARVPGMEGAGTIEELGPDGAQVGLSVGDRVAWVMHPGAYGEYASVPLGKLVPVPSDIELKTAAAAMLQGLTAQYLLGDSYAVQSGDVALVHAAAGGVGRLLTQLAAGNGGTVIGTVSSAAKADKARSLARIFHETGAAPMVGGA